MKMLANENFPSLAVTAMRDAGHDVLWAHAGRDGMIVADNGEFVRAGFRLGLHTHFEAPQERRSPEFAMPTHSLVVVRKSIQRVAPGLGPDRR